MMNIENNNNDQNGHLRSAIIGRHTYNPTYVSDDPGLRTHKSSINNKNSNKGYNNNDNENNSNDQNGYLRSAIIGRHTYNPTYVSDDWLEDSQEQH
jgi:hypothetical protein